MGKYNSPKVRLHHEFLYLNHDTVLNALSALEAGAVDEIIEKTTEAHEGGLEGGLSYGPLKAGGSKKKQSNIQEELVRTRTWFSAFDAWQRALDSHDAVGTFDVWDMDVRDAMSVGDTIRFEADVVLSPVHKILTTYVSFAANAGKQGSMFEMSGKELAEAKKTAQQMETWISGRSGRKNLTVYLAPGGVTDPRIVARLDEQYLIGGLDSLEGRFTVVGQIDSLLQGDAKESLIRILRDTPPTPSEIEVTTDALRGFIEPSRDLGVTIDESDLTFTSPTLVLRPIAIYK
jgi:hypothetical protein